MIREVLGVRERVSLVAALFRRTAPGGGVEVDLPHVTHESACGCGLESTTWAAPRGGPDVDVLDMGRQLVRDRGLELARGAAPGVLFLPGEVLAHAFCSSDDAAGASSVAVFLAFDVARSGPTFFRLRGFTALCGVGSASA